METTLPPYLQCYPQSNEVAHPMNFDHFKRHPSLPLAIRRDFYEAGDHSGLFYHVDFFALYVIRSGNGIHWIDNHPYGLVKGDVYLMAPGAAHEFCQFAGLELDAFFFQTNLFDTDELAALRDCPGLWQLFAGDLNIEHRIHLTPEYQREIEVHIEVMRSEWGTHTKAGTLILKHELFHLLIKLARLLETSNPTRTINDREKMAESGLAATLRFCEEHFDKPLSVTKLASRVFLSPGHFSELFIREVGMPPSAYIRCIRMEKARVLLRESEIPVAQVAARCGFTNAAQFSRAFRNFYQYSPLQYRKSRKQLQQIPEQQQIRGK
jgi:AraC-like DNA-binding protein